MSSTQTIMPIYATLRQVAQMFGLGINKARRHLTDWVAAGKVRTVLKGNPRSSYTILYRVEDVDRVIQALGEKGASL